MGMLNGDRGSGEVVVAGSSEVVLRWIPANDPPPLAHVDLILALPRPKVMKRLWAPLASMGVGRIVLTNAAKVARQYFDTHWLAPEFYTPLLIEGLEQSGDTRIPEVRVCRQLKPLVEDELNVLFPESLRLLAHPAGRDADTAWPQPEPGQRILLCAGPEGGWTEYELSLFGTHGFRRISLGWRTLRTDTACIALIAMAGTLLREVWALHHKVGQLTNLG